MNRSTRLTFQLLAGWIAVLSGVSEAQVLRVADLNAQQIGALDRSRTAVILPGGILEEHGPYLPSFSDGYLNEWVTRRIAEAIVARPEWAALVFPSIPLGNSGANDLGERYSFPGTYTVRFETLRTIYMDLADELGGQGFQWIFLVHLHGAPNHSRALDQAGDYFHDTYGGWMVHLAGLSSVMSAITAPKSPTQSAEDGFAIHAGMDETSWMLFLRPDLVDPGFREARAVSASSMEGLVPLAKAPGWPGYLGSPRLATAAHGATVVDGVAAHAVSTVMSVLDGADPRTLERFATAMEKSAADVALDAASRRAEAERAQKQREWIERHGR